MVWVLPSFDPQAALTVPELVISLSSTLGWSDPEVVTPCTGVRITIALVPSVIVVK